MQSSWNSNCDYLKVVVVDFDDKFSSDRFSKCRGIYFTMVEESKTPELVSSNQLDAQTLNCLTV